LLLDILYQIP